MKISIIHPSRSRPQKALQACYEWIDKASGKYSLEYILSLDSDDPELKNYHHDIGTVIINDNRSAIDAINNAAKICTGDIIVQIADDFSCPKDWDKIVIGATKGRKNWLLKTYDGAQNYIVTLPIMDIAFYVANGYLYFPGFDHMFADTDLTHKADIEGRIIWRNDIVFEHQHYSTGKAVKDDISRKADLTWNQGQSLYLQRCREAFGTGKDIWNIHENGAGHKIWLQNKLR